MKIKFKRGIGLVEVLVAVFIFTIILSSLILVSNIYLSGAGDNLRATQAAYLAEEGIEAVKTIRDNSWSNISNMDIRTDYYLIFNTNLSIWATTTTKKYDDVFLRSFYLENVMRDTDGRISDSGVVDSKTKKITVSVSWYGKTGTTTKSLKTYITDIVSE